MFHSNSYLFIIIYPLATNFGTNKYPESPCFFCFSPQSIMHRVLLWRFSICLKNCPILLVAALSALLFCKHLYVIFLKEIYGEFKKHKKKWTVEVNSTSQHSTSTIIASTPISFYLYADPLTVPSCIILKKIKNRILLLIHICV